MIKNFKKGEIKNKFDNVLNKFGINTSFWKDYFNLIGKLEFLCELNRYGRLLNNLFSSNDRNNFNSFAFEAAFAYDFESKGHKSIYEVKKLDYDNSSIDFLYKINDKKKVYFELRVINPGNPTISSNDYDMAVKVRVQNLILDKCQDKDGRPIKFEIESGSYNFIVAYVSELHLTMFDKIDCMITMYGDNIFGSDIYGLCQHLPDNATAMMKKYYDKFKHFRETIHGVLFVKNVALRDPRYFVNPVLEYHLIGNNNLLERQEFEKININLGSFLKPWKNQKS